MGIHPAALELRQGVERVPEPEKHFLAIQELLGAGLMLAGGIFDPVITVQGIICLVVPGPLHIGGLLASAGGESLGHLVSNLDKLILYVPIIKIFQIDGCHSLSSISFCSG